MRLESFRAWNYRSINDSGDINVARITALLGRNESGKSSLLRALHSLNPADGFEALNPIKDFPRHRRLEDCRDWTKVVSTLWTLTDKERQELTKRSCASCGSHRILCPTRRPRPSGGRFWRTGLSTGEGIQ